MASSSSELYDFLTEIGAAQISPKIELPSTSSSSSQPPPIAHLHQRIQQEITRIDDETRLLLNEHWPEFHRQVSQGQDLLAQLEQEERELEELESQLSGQAAFLPSLISQLTSHSNLTDSYAKTESSILLFSSLLSFHRQIASLSSLITTGSLPSAHDSLNSLHHFLTTSSPEPWITGTESWTTLRKWFGEEELRLESSITGAIEACFDFSGQPGRQVEFVNRDKIRAAPRGELLEVPVLFDLLEKVLEGKKRERKLEKQLERIAKQLLKYFIGPYLEKNGTMGKTDGGRLGWYYSSREQDGSTIRTVKLSPDLPSTQSPNDSPLPQLEQFLSFLKQHSSLLPPSPHSKIFTNHLTPSLQSLLISSHLSPSLPQSISLLPPYISILATAHSFESFLVQESFLPENRKSEENNVIREWIEGVSGHWARELGKDSLEKCREVVMNMGSWDSEQVVTLVEIEVEPEPEPEPPRIPSPPPAPKQLPKSKSMPLPQEPYSIPSSPPEPEPSRNTTPARRGRQTLGTRITTPLPPDALPPISPTLLKAELARARSPPEHALPPSARPLSTASNYSQSTVMALSPDLSSQSIKSGEGEEEDDLWGLGASTSKEKNESRDRTGSMSSQGSTGDDAWGFGEEEEEEEEEEEGEGLSSSPAKDPVESTLSPHTTVIATPPTKKLALKASTNSLHPDSAGKGGGSGRKRSGSVGSQLSMASSTGEDAWGFGSDDGLIADEEDAAAESGIELEENANPAEPEEEEKEDDAEVVGDTTIMEDEEHSAAPVEETPPVDGSGGEDGWGFSGDEKSGGEDPVEASSSIPVANGTANEHVLAVDAVAKKKAESSEGEGEGAWGFDDELVPSDSESALSASPTKPPKAPSAAVPAAATSPPLQSIQSPPLAATRSPVNLTPGTTPTLQTMSTPTLQPSASSPSSHRVPLAKSSPLAGNDGEEESHDAAEWGWGPEDEEETTSRKSKRDSSIMRNNGNGPLAKARPKPQFREEHMAISKKARVIVTIAQDILVNALEVGSPTFEHKTFANAAAPLLRSYISVLSLYRATTPVFHSKLLLSVPTIGMQFANDAQWISDEVEKSWQTLGKETGKKEDASRIEHAIQAMRLFSAKWREEQISIQRKALNDCLDEADGFVYTESDARFATCERALKELTYTLERLTQAWKPVMNDTLLYSTLGSLVNDVLTRVLTEIEGHPDISEQESIRLNQLCKILHGLESIFEGGSSSVGREVPIWFKFVFLSEFLEASMADILFLFDNGHLVDFSTSEISKLVRALFSDSPLRQRNLEHIARGHPDVIPSGDNSEDESSSGY